MRYRSILIQLSHAADLEQRVQIAARLAARDDACVIGLAITGVSNFMSDQLPLATVGSAPSPAIPVRQEDQRQGQGQRRLDMQTALQRFAQLAQQYGIAHTQQVQVDDDAASALSCHGNAADLIILGRSEMHGGKAVSAGRIAHRSETDFIEFVTLNAAAPVLTTSEKPFAWRHALIAWNSSSAAARAARNALPLLRDVNQISAVIFGDGKAPGMTVAASEQGLRDRLAVLPQRLNILHQPATEDVGHALLKLAAKLDADLIVMGCVAHPRWRGALLGGATGVVINESPVALLLSR